MIGLPNPTWNDLDALVVHTFGFLPKLDESGQPILNPETILRLVKAAEVSLRYLIPIILPQSWGKVENKWFWMPDYEQQYILLLHVTPQMIIVPDKQPEGTRICGTGGELRLAIKICVKHSSSEKPLKNLGFVTNPIHMLRVRLLAWFISRKLHWSIKFYPICSTLKLPLLRTVIQEMVAYLLMIIFLDFRAEGKCFTWFQKHIPGG